MTHIWYALVIRLNPHANRKDLGVNPKTKNALPVSKLHNGKLYHVAFKVGEAIRELAVNRQAAFGGVVVQVKSEELFDPQAIDYNEVEKCYTSKMS